MTNYVIDASVAIKWVVSEPGSRHATKFLQHALAAPDLILAECMNILWKKVVRREITQAEAEVAAATLDQVDWALFSARRRIRAALDLAIGLGHPAYDCFYIALAAELGVPFVTADRRLAGFASSQRMAGVRIELIQGMRH